MLQLSLTNCSSTSELLTKAIDAAEYYGFQPMESALSSHGPRSKIEKIAANDLSFVHSHERSLLPFAQTCARSGLCSTGGPMFFWRPGASKTSGPQKTISLELHVLGVPSAIAEALLLSVAHAIANDSGVEKRVVHVNSIGSFDSSARYVRELSAYLRKNSDLIAETILSRVPSDPLGALLSLAEKQSPVVARAPQSMEFLNEEERKHLAQVLEYLEAAESNYKLNPFVLGSRDLWAHTLFEMHGMYEDTEDLVPFARGGRYDTILSRSRGEPGNGVGMTLTFELRGTRKPAMRSKMGKQAPPLYFAHLGTEAKRRSLSVIELLRRAQIPVQQSLTYEHLGEQMEEAKKLPAPYMMIMGYKEATEGTVLVRNTHTNAQQAIPTGDLVGYLRRRHIAQSA